MTQYLGANAAAYAAGEPIPYVFAPNFWDYFMGFSGSGITGALVILALFSKSRELKAVGKVSVVPAIFTISSQWYLDFQSVLTHIYLSHSYLEHLF